MVFRAGLKNAFGTRCRGGDGPAPRLPKELEFELASNPACQPRRTDWRPPAAKDLFYCHCSWLFSGLELPGQKPSSLGWVIIAMP